MWLQYYPKIFMMGLRHRPRSRISPLSSNLLTLVGTRSVLWRNLGGPILLPCCATESESKILQSISRVKATLGYRILVGPDCDTRQRSWVAVLEFGERKRRASTTHFYLSKHITWNGCLDFQILKSILGKFKKRLNYVNVFSSTASSPSGVLRLTSNRKEIVDNVQMQ